MKIDKTNRTGSSSKVRSSKSPKRTGGADFNKVLQDQIDDLESAAGASGSAPLSGVDALWAIQASEDVNPDEKKRRQTLISHGEDLIDHLERIRLALLGGEFTKQDLEKLHQTLQKQHQIVQDPGLIRVINEIDLRARVELAKLQSRKYQR